MLKGIWIYSTLKHKTMIWLENNEILYSIWGTSDGIEFRILVNELSLNDIHKIRNEFGIPDGIKIKNYDYLILYY
jgi:hypothetical protein